jgi:hypothetical protein
MTPAPLRLDTIVRWIVHQIPDLALPYLSGRTGELHKFRNFRRLDTQLAPSRYSPDTAYTFEFDGVQEVIIVEAQKRAIVPPPWRASTCAVQTIQQLTEFQYLDRVRVRLLEARTGQRHRVSSRHTAQARSSGEEGVISFTKTSVLLQGDTRNRFFDDPQTWPILGINLATSADRILELHNLTFQRDTTKGEYSMVRVLLGAVGRARFPNNPRLRSLYEASMRQAISQPHPQWGYMTIEEVKQLLGLAPLSRKDAFRVSKAGAMLKGRTLGRRKGRLEGQLDGALTAAEAMLSAVLTPSELADAMAILAQQTSGDDVARLAREILMRQR